MEVQRKFRGRERVCMRSERKTDAKEEGDSGQGEWQAQGHRHGKGRGIELGKERDPLG